ncbi:MAG: trypsin-like serine protease [Myxococcales bacterium]|nr:trypsin-like serine protease [Myxococcales bacterium]
MSRSFALGLLALTACTAGVDAGAPAGERVGRAAQPVIAGQPSDARAVVLLARYDEDGVRRGLCTGTLVADNLVLTARHCVSVTESQVACAASGEPVVGGAVLSDRDPASLRVFVGGDAASRSLDIMEADAGGSELVVADASVLCNRDLAFVVLDRKVTGADIAPIRLTGGARVGETLRSVGYGLTEGGTLPTGRVERDGVVVASAGPLVDPDDARVGIGSAEFSVGESTCSGDSGGPTLSAAGAVVGVVSRGGGGTPDPQNLAAKCMGANVHVIYTHLGLSRDLVSRAFAAAGATPWLEGQPRPGTARPPEPSAPCGAPGAPCATPTPSDEAPPTSEKTTTSATLDVARPTTDEGGCRAAPAGGRDASTALVVIAAASALTRRRRRARR